MIGGWGFGGALGNRSGLGASPPAPPEETPDPVIIMQIDIGTAVEQDNAVYSPASEGNLVAWFDFSDAANYTLNGGSTAYTAIKNKVSGVIWTPTDGTLPYEASGLNGHSCAHPAVVGDALISTESAVVTAGDTTSASKPYTWFTVWQADTLDVASYIFGWGNSGQATDDVRGFGQSSASTGRYGQHIVNPSAAVVSSTASTDSTTAHTHCWHGDATHSFHLDGGTAAPSGASQSVVGITPNRAALFCQPRATPASPGVGRCGEVLIYSAELDSTARGRVQAYLKAKWGTP